MPAKRPPDPDRLIRQTPGTYRTEDGRFEVRGEAGGRWYVADTERTNELGLELVLGPLTSLAEAREAVARQRGEPTGAEAGALPTETPRKTSRTPPEKSHQKAATQGSRPNPAPARPPPPPKPTTRFARRHPTGDERDDVAATLRRIAEAWIHGAPDSIAEEIHEKVVFTGSDGRETAAGRSAAIEALRQPRKAGRLSEYREDDLWIRSWGGTAVASLRYQVTWTNGEGDRKESATDLYVLALNGKHWRVVWRRRVG